MGENDGQVVSTTKVINNRPDNAGWNLVVLGDGFRAQDMAAYETAVGDFIQELRTTQPFDEVFGEINVFRINVESTDAGADDPTACGGPGSTPATFFDASFCNSGVRRLLLVNDALALRIANENVAAVHAVIVVVNSTTYGGAGGSVGTYSLASQARQIAIHELGHTAFGLADEYEYFQGCGVDTDRNNHGPFEPSEPNVTVEDNRADLKWRNFIDPATPIPTTSNADCTQCDPQGNPQSATTVGLYEGAHYFHCDAFRPQFDCKMRTLGEPFCAVCQQRIRENFQCWTAEFECTRTRDDGYSTCTATADQGYQQCTQTRDDGYNSCTQWRDNGYNACCDWIPCKWFCSALVWIASWVCMAWTWISNVVCVAWTWISNVVCVAWTWISHIVCIAWRKLTC